MYQGLEALHISGSAQPSADGFRGLIKEIRKHTNGPIYDIDLKQETHGFANGEAVSRYGKRNWGNVGKSLDQILAEENRELEVCVRGMPAEEQRLLLGLIERVQNSVETDWLLFHEHKNPSDMRKETE